MRVPLAALVMAGLTRSLLVGVGVLIIAVMCGLNALSMHQQRTMFQSRQQSSQVVYGKNSSAEQLLQELVSALQEQVLSPQQEIVNLSPAEEPSSQVLPIAGAFAKEKPVNCLFEKPGELRCQVQEQSPRHGSDEQPRPVWPGVIGIGPAKTGSSALSHVLDAHPDIEVGDAFRGGRKCCGPELYFFTDGNQYSKGLPFYSDFFLERTGSVLASEKTPTYADHPLVPYRVRTALGHEVKLIMTIRDSVDAMASLYEHRMRKFRQVQAAGDDAPQVSIPTFAEWVQDKVEKYEAYTACAKDVFEKLWLPQMNLVAPTINNWREQTTWQTAYLIDTHLHDKCWIGKVDFDAMTHYDYLTNLHRWKHVFGASSVLCVFHEDLTSPLKKPEVFKAVTEFLDLDPGKLPPGTLDMPSVGSALEQRLSHTAIERIREFEGAVVDQVEYEAAVQSLKEIFKTNTLVAIRELCEESKTNH